MTQSSCKQDTKSKSHVGMKFGPVGVFSCKHPLRFRRCLFTLSIKGEMGHLYVIVTQKRQRNVTKKRDARAKLLFCL